MAQPNNEERQRFARLNDDLGPVAAARLLGSNHVTFQRALVGLEIRHSTLRKLRAGLAKLASEQTSSAPVSAASHTTSA